MTRTYLLGGPLHELLDEHGRSSIHGAARWRTKRETSPRNRINAGRDRLPLPFAGGRRSRQRRPFQVADVLFRSGIETKPTKTTQGRAGQGERWRGVEDGREGWGRGGVCVRRAVKDQVLVASWPFSFLLCAALCSLDWLLRWHGKFGLRRMKEREEERASAGGLKGRSLGQAD